MSFKEISQTEKLRFIAEKTCGQEYVDGFLAKSLAGFGLPEARILDFRQKFPIDQFIQLRADFIDQTYSLEEIDKLYEFLVYMHSGDLGEFLKRAREKDFEEWAPLVDNWCSENLGQLMQETFNPEHFDS